MKRIIALLMFLIVILGTSLHAQKSEINTENLQKLIQFSQKTFTDEIMLVHNNEVICNWKNPECDSIYYSTSSMLKSWTGLVIGILIDKGLITSESDLVCKYIPEWEDGCRYQVSIKHLLTMSAGLNRRRGANGILGEENINEYATHLKLDTLPGVRFGYSNGSVQLLGMIVEKVTGKSANDAFQEHLFGPLGMDSTKLYRMPNGQDVTFGGARTTVDDAVNIGLLMLNGGKHRNKQIVSADWVKKSITPADKSAFYGYLWWLDNISENKNYAATGDGGELTIVFPDLNLVFIRKQSCKLEISGNMPWMGPDYLKLIASVINK